MATKTPVDQLKPIPVSLALLVVNIAMATEKWNLFNVDLTQVCSCYPCTHCSLRANGLTDTGAAALARVLKHNESLKELK